MKISPLAQGTGVPAASDVNIGRSASPDRIAAAKAVASGQEVPSETSGDTQVDRIQNNRKSIKMRTQQSTNRHETPVEQVVEALTEVPKPLTDEPAQETEETRPLSPQYAALMKQKRALQVKEREILAREEALKTQSQSQAGNADYISKADLIANPLKIFEAGLTYDQLTEAIMNQSQSVDPMKLREDIKRELKEELLGEFTSRDQQTEQQVLGEIKREALQLTAEGDDFEAIREEKAHDQVVKLVHKVYKEGWEDKGFPAGHILDTREAAQIVEDFLIDESLKRAQYKKVQSRLSPQQVAEQIPAPKPGTKIMRTLTNRDTASPVMDKRARAIAAMQGTLKR